MSKTLRELTLATVTVTGDLYHVSGADLLDKRITIDDISTAVRETLKGALVADGNVTIETGGLLLARADENVTQEIGKVKVWGQTNIAYVSHYDFATPAGAGWQQNASGDAYINASTGRTAGIRIANGNILTATGTLITATKPITLAGDFTQTSGVFTNTNGNLVTHQIGNMSIYGAAGAMYLGQFQLDLTDEFAVGQGAAGTLFLNAKTGADISFRKHNVEVGSVTDTAFEFGMNTTITGLMSSTTASVAGNITQTAGVTSLLATTITGGGGGDLTLLRNDGSIFSNELGALNFAGNDTDTGLHTSAIIRATSIGEWTAVSAPSKLDFYVTAIGSIIPEIVITASTTAIELLKPTTITGLLTANTGISTTGVMSAGSAAITGALACATIDTGHGAVEAYAMDQPVRTTDAVEFSGGVKTDGTILKTKIIAIGDWNMPSTGTVSLVHNLSFSKIRSVTAFIRNDGDTLMYSISYKTGASAPSGGITVTQTVVGLSRYSDGAFMTTDFDDTSYNRGYIHIVYEA